MVKYKNVEDDILDLFNWKDKVVRVSMHHPKRILLNIYNSYHKCSLSMDEVSIWDLMSRLSKDREDILFCRMKHII